MLATLDRSELASKDDWSLIWACVSSFISEVRGKSESLKMGRRIRDNPSSYFNLIG
jgi:hypothetical protein